MTIHRQTRNNEKYSKNKERNKQRAIDLERFKVRAEAVRQAERLAAKYDPTGKTFNVDAVVVMPDGSVKSVEKIKLAAERGAAEEAAKKEAERQKLEDAVNPERQALIQTGPKPPRISKKQQKRQALYAPKPVPPKPILPEGISIPEGEEDFISQFDITDEGILKRLSEQKKKKSLAARALRRKQKEESKFRKAMKLMKKEADRLGVLFDADAAKKEILGLTKRKKTESDSGSDTTSDSESESDSEAEEEVKKLEAKVDCQKPKKAKKGLESKVAETVANVEPVETEAPDVKKIKKAKRHSEARAAEAVPEPEVHEPPEVQVAEVVKKSKKSKRTEADTVEGEPKSKKSKMSKKSKSSDDVEMKGTCDTVNNIEPEDAPMTEALVEKKKKKSKHSSDVGAEAPSNEIDENAARKERKRLRKEKKRQEEPAKARVEASSDVKEGASTQKSKKRKHEDETEILAENGATEKSHKKKKAKSAEEATNGHTNGAEQWNPDELTGDTARKDKFLRLLGAGKTNGSKEESSSKKKSSKKSSELSHMEAELERQYEAGMKQKHDGHGKRRGLGA